MIIGSWSSFFEHKRRNFFHGLFLGFLPWAQLWMHFLEHLSPRSFSLTFFLNAFLLTSHFSEHLSSTFLIVFWIFPALFFLFVKIMIIPFYKPLNEYSSTYFLEPFLFKTIYYSFLLECNLLSCRNISWDWRITVMSSNWKRNPSAVTVWVDTFPFFIY